MRDATRLGAYLAGREIVPDVALVSAAARTRQTFERVAAAFPKPIPASFDETLYNATAGELRVLLRTMRADARTILVVGHNPGIADLSAMVARDGDLGEITRLRAKFSPCSLALVSFRADDWADALAAGGRLDLFVQPEDLEG